MPQTEAKVPNPHLALASLVCSASAALIGWNSLGTSLNGILQASTFAVPLHYVGVGIRKKNQLTWSDHKAIAPMIWSALVDGAKAEQQSTIAPMIKEMRAIPGVDRINIPSLDLSPLLNHSTIVTAPTGTGKSFFMSLLLTEWIKANPGCPLKICTIDTFKRNQTWMGIGLQLSWIQRMYITLGYKYRDHAKDFSTAIHLETVDEVSRLYNLMQSRSEERAQVGPNGEMDLTPSLVVIDELPEFLGFLNDKEKFPEGPEIRRQLKMLLTRGQGWNCLVYGIAQDDAVGMLGFSQAEKKQVMLCNLYNETVSGNGDRAALINSIKGRRFLLEHGGKGVVMPIPHLDKEPEIDFSHLTKDGSFYAWIEELKPLIVKFKEQGASITEVWRELTSRADFPGKKRNGTDNPHYAYFTDQIWR
ncbi:MAG: DEAD/DEAH box helicase family protein [Cyanobacteria bacterium P01_F01_bin.150]